MIIINDKNKEVYALTSKIVISTIALGLIAYYIYPEIDKHKELAGYYYTLTTMLSVIIGILIDLLFSFLFELEKTRAGKKVMESDPTPEYAHIKKEIEENNSNKAAKDYAENYK